MAMADRRSLLKALGISVPAALVATPKVHAVAMARQTLTPQEVFEIYVSEAMHQFGLRGMSTELHSTNRQVAEILGAALAAVKAVELTTPTMG